MNSAIGIAASTMSSNSLGGFLVAKPSATSSFPKQHPQLTLLCIAVETFEEKVETVEVDICELNIQLDESQMMCAAMTDAVALLPDLREEMDAIRLQLRILQRVVGNGQAFAQEYAPRLKIPEPLTYGGARDAKENVNFLFDMEQYFLAVNIEDEARRVTTAIMYLGGDAKLWWRTKYDDIQANRVQIDTWDLLKETITIQFFPENVEYQARRVLRELKHTRSIRNCENLFRTYAGHICWTSETCLKRTSSSLS
ncbi:Uncharacterized protein Adt_14568 [Abeliophyllum distichum]|uniref:Retrotransposon gag domain-containing protein n=1 Tax=Abeliophyllum distichum TaxID=126358 RepID=A0ABD1U000_9LAMI